MSSVTAMRGFTFMMFVDQGADRAHLTIKDTKGEIVDACTIRASTTLVMGLLFLDLMDDKQ